MAKHHIPDSHSAHPNVTPLIDIIMCLIIFFMLVAKIGAEYVARLLPAGTHDWRKFVKPEELGALGRATGLRLTDLAGMVYSPAAAASDAAPWNAPPRASPEPAKPGSRLPAPN